MKVLAKTAKESFKPIELNITLETEQDLLTMLGCFNICFSDIRKNLNIVKLQSHVDVDSFTPSDIVPLYTILSDYAVERGVK